MAAEKKAEKDVGRKDLDHGLLERLVAVTAEVLKASTVRELLERAVEGACDLTRARTGLYGAVLDGGRLLDGAVCNRPDLKSTPREELSLDKGGLYLGLMSPGRTLRLSREDILSHPRREEIFPGQAPPNGLLGVRMGEAGREPEGLILVAGKEKGGFTAADEAVLSELALLISHGFGHLQARDKARQNANELQAVMDAVPVAVWVAHDPKLSDITGNEYSYRLLRIPRGANPSQTAPPESRPGNFQFHRDGEPLPKDQTPMRLAASTGKVQEGQEFEIVFNNGDRVSLFGSASPLLDHEGKVSGVVGVFVDITRKRHHSDHLEALVENRTRQLVSVSERLSGARKEIRAMSQRLLDATEAERRRVARELHDSLGSQLTALKFHIELQALKKKDDPEIAATCRQALEMAQEAIRETRRISKNLWPSILNDLGLLPALRELVRDHEAVYPAHQFKTRLPDDPLPLGREAKVAAYRIAQEALQNAVKYSKARRITVAAETACKSVVLLIEDNGVGFDLDLVPETDPQNGGMGLASMEERAELTGGRLTLWSAPRRGTAVRAVWPVRPEGPEKV